MVSGDAPGNRKGFYCECLRPCENSNSVTSLERRHKGIILTTKTLYIDSLLKGQQRLAHVQLVVKSLDLDEQAVFGSHQLVLQLGHLSLVGRLRQVVAQDVDQQVKQDHAGGTREARQEEEEEKVSKRRNAGRTGAEVVHGCG